jgi:hypothetical protein
MQGIRPNPLPIFPHSPPPQVQENPLITFGPFSPQRHNLYCTTIVMVFRRNGGSKPIDLRSMWQDISAQSPPAPPSAATYSNPSLDLDTETNRYACPDSGDRPYSCKFCSKTFKRRYISPAPRETTCADNPPPAAMSYEIISVAATGVGALPFPVP